MASCEEKLVMLRKAWGHVELVQAQVAQSGWIVWVVKNYSGKFLDTDYRINGEGLPGNPKATTRFEYMGHTDRMAISRALESLKRRGWNTRMRKIDR